MNPLSCFKAYDVRGKLGNELNENIAYRIGYAFATYLQAQNIVIGGDIRPSTPLLKKALAAGIIDAGAYVYDIGLSGSEEIYFASAHLNVEGGIEVTASHNPENYNGMKFVHANGIAFDSSDLNSIRLLAEKKIAPEKFNEPKLKKVSTSKAYLEKLLTLVDIYKFIPLKIIVNSGNGAAGHVIDALEAVFQEKNIPITFIKLHHHPDSTFPNGVANPMIVENRLPTQKAIQHHKADIGIAFDGDFDRCFFFDETGTYIENSYIVGLIAEVFLKKHKDCRIVHDSRNIWNIQDLCQKYHGKALQSKAGHTFIKKIMREEKAIYGGESSGHHYFRDFYYCDSGMLPWLFVVELLSLKKQKLSFLVQERVKKFPCSEEKNYYLDSTDDVLKKVENALKKKNGYLSTDYLDGLSMTFHNWRFNLRASNTEPLMRLNVEFRENANRDEIIKMLNTFLLNQNNTCN